MSTRRRKARSTVRNARDPATHAEPFRASFVGRDQDIAGVERLVAEGARLVTLLGPGGVGKTRLLHRLTTQLSPTFDSTLWCDLSSARSCADVVGCVAAMASGIASGAAATTNAATERVTRALSRRGRCLLALDNLEQLEEAALPPLVHWIGAIPSLVVLTTSRVRLGIIGEHVHHVGPLSLVSSDAGPSDALRLFEDRALAVRSACSPEELAIMNRIVALLEGIPLALEMAATRLCFLDPQELLDRLSRPLAVLSATGRSHVGRHASLSRVMDESWELLADADRQALAELGVFLGGFTVEAVEAVLSIGDGVAHSLPRLVDSSLVRAIPSRTSRRRHAPYAVVREYALERLTEEGRVADVRLRHATYFAAWAEEKLARFGRGASKSRGGVDEDAENTLRELIDEASNLGVAAEFAGSGPLHLRLLAVLEPVRMLGGQLEEWAAQLALALETSKDSAPDLRARLRLALARALHELGRPEHAMAAYEGAIAEAHEAGDATLHGLGLVGFGRLLAGFGEWERAGNLFATARSLVGVSDVVRKLAHACHAYYGTETQIPENAIAAVGDYVAECRRGADPRELVFWLVQLARLESELIRAGEDADAHLEEALTLARRLGDLRGEGFALFGQGTHRMAFGRYDDAVATLEDAARILNEAGSRRYAAWAIGFQGTSHAAKGRWSQALIALGTAIELLSDVGDAPRQAHLYGVRAVVHARLDETARASADLARASELAAPESLYHAWTLDLCRGQLEVQRARAAVRQGAHEEAKALLASAQALLVRAGWPTGGCASARTWPWGSEFFEPRIAAELLEDAIRDAGTARGALLVAHDGSTFILPSGEHVVAAPREKLQRFLVVLTNERLSRPGRAIDAATLVEALWPGEQIVRTAARNRLHVALDGLRKLGLRQLLLREEGGWLLDPSIPCAWGPRGG